MWGGATRTRRDRPASGRLSISGRLIAGAAFAWELRARDDLKAQVRIKPKRGRDAEVVWEAEDDENFLAPDGEAFEGFALAARRASGPGRRMMKRWTDQTGLMWMGFPHLRGES